MTDPTASRMDGHWAGGRDRRQHVPKVPVAPALAVAGFVAAALTLFVTFTPGIRFAYRSVAAHATIETAALLSAAVAAILVAGRARRSLWVNDLLLAAALACFAAANLVFSLLPLLAGWSAEFSAWGSLAGRGLGALLFLGAAVLPDRRMTHPRRALAQAALAIVAALGAIALVLILLGDRLPTALDPDLSPETANRARLVGHPVVIAVQAVLIGVYAAATAGFATRAARRHDRLLRGFAVASLVATFARVNYFLFPSLYSDWVYTGDLLRVAQYLVILGAIVLEMLDYQRRATVAAVLDERRRVARELHDGLAQELAFIRGSATRIRRGDGIDRERLNELISASDRALHESRSAIAALSRPLNEPLLDGLRHSAESVALRAGARVVVTGDEIQDMDLERRHALLRIVREAAGNATDHGDAREIVVEVHRGPPLCVTIRDDGQGFDPDTDVGPDSFGLAGMRDRAEGLDGRLEVKSSRGEGTTITVWLP